MTKHEKRTLIAVFQHRKATSALEEYYSELFSSPLPRTNRKSKLFDKVVDRYKKLEKLAHITK